MENRTQPRSTPTRLIKQVRMRRISRSTYPQSMVKGGL